MKNLAQLRQHKHLLIAAALLAFAACTACFCGYVRSFAHGERTPQPTAEQRAYLSDCLDATYPAKRRNILRALPYGTNPAVLDIAAESAILIDTANGCVLYEKNADEAIPPASIAKLFVMYIAFQEIAAGRVSLDDVVPLPENSWAVNLPRDASLMFLGQGQTVTLRELMRGLAVASGNDAAIAVATYLSGSVKDFVARMNDEAQQLGLRYTHFVEPSGYSEDNVTTARELAAFARVYVNRYPQSLTDFHSVPEISYPLEANLAPWMKDRGDSMAVTQRNTNVLLHTLDGCDGLKTGFIYESGFNIALTARRDGMRYLSVTMRGPGRTTREGNQFRERDGRTLMEWAFASFADYIPLEHIQPSYPLAVTGAKGRFTRLEPAWTTPISVPHVTGETPHDAAAQVTATVVLPTHIFGGTRAGEAYGKIEYKLGDLVLETVPLVSDRTVARAGLWGRFWGTLASAFMH